MRYFFALLLMVISCRAASPSFSSFNTNQFSTNNLFISIKDGAVITNLNVITDLFINSTNIVNLFAPSSVTNGTMINPTDNFIPYRTNATTFADSRFEHRTTFTKHTGIIQSQLYSTGLIITTLLADGLTLTASSGVFRIGSDDPVAANRTFHITSGTLENIDLLLQWTGANAGELPDTDVNLVLSSTWTPSDGHLLKLIWDTIDGVWREEWRYPSVGGSGDSLWFDVASAATLTNSMESMVFFHDLNAGDDDSIALDYFVTTDQNFTNYAGLYAPFSSTSSSIQSYTIFGNAGPTEENRIQLSTDATSASIQMLFNGVLTDGFNVATPSGYTGAGTLFLSDDGTYKAAGGVGGDSIWTNVANSGYVTMIPGQTATNTLGFVSGAADNATNVVATFGTVNSWDPTGGALLLALQLGGTNQHIVGPKGNLLMGSRFSDWYSLGDPSMGLVQVVNSDFDGYASLSWNAAVFNDAFNVYALSEQALNIENLATPRSEITWTANGTNTVGKVHLRASLGDEQAYIQASGTTRTHLRPSVLTSGSAVAYLFDTSNTLTNGDKFVSIGNAGTPLLTIAPAEASNPAAQIVWGPGTTNVLYRSNQSLVYTNGTTTGYGYALQDPSGIGLVTYGILSGGSAKISAPGSQGVYLSPDNGSANYYAGPTAFQPANANLDLGTTGVDNRWRDLHLDRRIAWNGATNTLFDTWGTATPEGAESARPGSVFRNTADVGVLSLKTDGTGNTGWQTVHVGNQAYLAANGTVSDATLVNLSLSVGVTSGKKYAFRCVLYCANSTAGDGVKIDFDGGSAAATNFRAHTKITDAALLTSTQTSALATDITAATITGDTEIEVNGSFEPSGTGTLIPRFAENSDGGGTLTVYRGSHLIVTEIP